VVSATDPVLASHPTTRTYEWVVAALSALNVPNSRTPDSVGGQLSFYNPQMGVWIVEADEKKLKHYPGCSRVLLPVGLSGSVRIHSASSHMRERIRKRLKEYRAEALQSIGIAVDRTRSQLSSKGRTNSDAWYRAINKDNEAGFKKYMDQSAKFIRQIAPGSSAEYVDELYDGGQKLKREIMAKTDHVAASGNSIAVQLRTELEAALDKLIERKVEDF
jgi:hypothetical protein